LPEDKYRSDIDGGGVVSLSGAVDLNTTLRQTIPIYGRILTRQSDAATGTYTDLSVVELNC